MPPKERGGSFELACYPCYTYPCMCPSQCDFSVYIFELRSGLADLTPNTTATAEGPSVGTQRAVSKASRRDAHPSVSFYGCTVVYARPCYLLLSIAYFFLHSVVNKVQSNLLPKCSFLFLNSQGTVSQC